jgi:hypothetical protein
MAKLRSGNASSKGMLDVDQAKAHGVPGKKPGELIEKAQSEASQGIAGNGRDAAVVASAEERRRKTIRQGTLAEFLLASPLRGSGVEIKRLPGRLRKVDL